MTAFSGLVRIPSAIRTQDSSGRYSVSTAFCSAILEVEMMMGRAICPVGKADAAVAAAR